MTTSPSGLARKSVGTSGLAFLGVSASAPMTVLAGGVVATFATTGVVGVPLSFLLLMAPLLLISVGLVTFSRDVSHTAAFYAFLAHGLGRGCGVAGAAVAILAYNAIQIALYGLFGATMAGLLGGPWWVWALLAWAVVGLIGVRHIEVSTRVLAGVLTVEITVIVLFVAAALTHPADPATSVAPLLPSGLLVDGLGGVLALSVAAFIGFESIIAYGEEARGPRSIRRAAVGTLTFLGLFYALASWALAVTVGAPDVVSVARDPGAGLPFSILDSFYGPQVSTLGIAVLVMSVLAAMVSFHNVVARYVHGLAREGVLPTRWGAIGGSRGGVPLGGSLAQSAAALVTIAVFAISGADPITSMFTSLSAVAALGVMVMMIGASAAVIRFYSLRTVDRPPRWRWLTAPAIGGVALTVTLLVTIANLDAVAGAAGAQTAWTLPAAVVLTAVAGAVWGRVLRRRRPGTYAAIGRGQPKPLAVLDRALSHLEL